MAKQPEIQARNKRGTLERLLDLNDERLAFAIACHAAEVRRILAIAEREHIVFKKPRKYWNEQSKS